DEIKRSDIVRLLDKIEDDSGARSADVALAYIGKVLNWHAARSDDFRSPLTRGMRRHGNQVHTRVLSDDELRAVWWAADGAGEYGAFIKFILLTAARYSEAADLPWPEIEGSIWNLPTARDKVKKGWAHPLSQAALDLLAGRPRILGDDRVFHFSSENRLKDRL